MKLTSFIDSLSFGINTWLGSKSVGLLVGQAQRLQIAPLLLLRPEKVLILNKPTKGLDRGKEEAVMINILAHVRKHKQTLLAVTHFCDGFIFLHQVNFIESYRPSINFDNTNIYHLAKTYVTGITEVYLIAPHIFNVDLHAFNVPFRLLGSNQNTPIKAYVLKVTASFYTLLKLLIIFQYISLQINPFVYMLL
ncbi:hypothetical protein H4J45_13975 [Colwellia sp. BRX10-6]|uniref:hypothetical protein n=1 Tax=unclassified Colwellia TaxID=196834 RepID=UPI0015F5DF6C|nr:MULTISPECIES: hypothetical protein [unclassified Colwellia]MBA6384164.1 hypothetical protein [Colwellia sp. BRX10-9]MBA6395193.1 hypothetical protein [Colwellia sp. BRX10-6]